MGKTGKLTIFPSRDGNNGAGFAVPALVHLNLIVANFAGKSPPERRLRGDDNTFRFAMAHFQAPSSGPTHTCVQRPFSDSRVTSAVRRLAKILLPLLSDQIIIPL